MTAAEPTLPIRRDAALERRLREALGRFAIESQATGAHRRAAVALAVVDEGHGADLPGLPAPSRWSDRAALILTRRADGLRHHAGQWALPGGRLDDGESPEQAALRELEEEVGWHVEPTAILGRLDDFVTRSGFAVTPLVVWAGAARRLKSNPGEVASIHRIPLDELTRPDAPLLDAGAPGTQPVLRMPVGDSWIAAPTAAFMYQFREALLFGRATRVSHFEQPEFAWR